MPFRFLIHSLCVLLCTCFAGLGYGQYWMQKGGGLTVEEGYDIAIDGSNNTYTTGYFSGNSTFGSTTLTSNGGTDIFVVKTNSSGVFQWAMKAGGSGSDRGLSIEVDGSGNCYVTGYFNDSASFGTASVISEGLQDIFIAKYNTSGTLQWVKRAGGESADIGKGIALDNSNNVIVTGEFKDSADFGSTTLVSNNGTTDAFITKLSNSGAFTWTEHGSGASTISGTDVACDDGGNIYSVGRFSGSVVFDANHNNAMLNVVYVIKFNSSGAEQWFRIIGAGSSNIGNAIESDAAGNSYVTGDFTGTVTFFGSTNTNLSNTFDNRVFVAKYSAAGTLTWAASSGSDSDITSRAIAVDDSSNVYIAGHFGCRLDEYSATYGKAIFNSVGYSDIYISKFSSAGSWLYAKHIGGPDDDYAFGIDAKGENEAHITGSFKSKLNFPVSDNFLSSNLNNWSNVSCNSNNGYCSDPDYGTFYQFLAQGNSDVVIANCFDPDRSPYDYYSRDGSGCDRSIIPPCIDPNCPDTIEACLAGELSASSNTCIDAGPDYSSTVSWHWGSFTYGQSNIVFGSGGPKSVTLKTLDGCFASSDTTELIVHHMDLPTLTDDVGVYVNATNPNYIGICAPDTVHLTGGNFNITDSIVWTGTGSNLGSGSNDSTVAVYQTGTYTFTVFDTNGCQRFFQLFVKVFQPMPPFVLAMAIDDSITVCENESFEVWVYDTVSNPNGTNTCFNNTQYNLATDWNLDPYTLPTELCETSIHIYPEDTGYLVITATFTRWTPCDTDTFVVVDSIFVTVLPAPEIVPYNIQISGSHYFCPGDSTELTASGGPNYLWTGTGINGVTDSTVMAYTQEDVNIESSLSDTNIHGCIASYTTYASFCLGEKQQPEVTASSLLICPNDTVTLTATHESLQFPSSCFLSGYSYAFTNNFSWEGPNGPIADSSNSIQVTEPGQYYCTYNDEDSCDLISNTIELTQYTTPQLAVLGDPVLCTGDSVTIGVIANQGAVIEWQAPLSGSEQQKTVGISGTYTCSITACGITTLASVEIYDTYVDAAITQSRPLCLDDTIVLYGSPGMDSYLWFPDGQTTDSILVSEAGTFTLSTTDTSNCPAIADSFFVSMNQVPTIIGLDTIPTFCVGDTIELYGNDQMSTYQWVPTLDSTRSILATYAGSYSLITKDTNGCVGSDTVQLYQPTTSTTLSITGDTSFCEGDSVILRASKGGYDNYTWLPIDSNGRTLVVFQSGEYILQATDSFGCNALASPVNVYVQTNDIEIPSISDTVICNGIPVELFASTNKGEIQWYDADFNELLHFGESYTTPTIDTSLTLVLWSTLGHCASDTTSVHITTIECGEPFLPNYLTPNGDGINDVFRIELNKSTCYSMTIFNRWGQLLYRSDLINQGWDGTITNTGEYAVDGVYFYIVDYCKFDGTKGSKQGSVTLVRH